MLIRERFSKLLILILSLVMVGTSCQEQEIPSCMKQLLATPPSPPNLPGFEQPNTVVGGVTNMIEVKEAYAYINAGSAFIILDVNNPISPRQVSDVRLPYAISSIEVVDNYAYIGTFGGVYVIDISQPGLPQIISCQNSSIPLRGMSITNDYIYTINWRDGEDAFHVLNKTNPANIFELSTYELSTPSQLRLFPRPALLEPPEYFVIDIASKGEYAYVIEGTPTDVGNHYNTTLRILDVSNPRKPRTIAINRDEYNSDYGNLRTVVIDADSLYLSTPPGLGTSYMFTFDISDPARPVRTPFVLPGGLLGIFGTYAYVVEYRNRFQIWDIADRTAPFLLSEIELTSLPSDIDLFNDHLYLAIPSEGLKILNIADPTQPQMVSSFATIATVGGAAVAEQRAYLTSNGKLQVVDFSDPNHLITVGSLSANVNDITVIEDYGYAVIDKQELWIVDISQPTLPVLATYIPENFELERVAVSNGYAYLIGNDAELRIVDVSTPTAPVEVGTYARAASSFYDIAVSSGYGYISMNESQLLILNLSDAAHVFEVTFYDNIPSFAELAANRDYLFAEGGGLLKAFSLAQPATPDEIGIYPLPNSNLYIDADADHVYVIDWNGMTSFKFTSDPLEPSDSQN